MALIFTCTFLVTFAYFINKSQAQVCTGGLAPNPPDCTTYLQCDNGRYVTRACPSGLYWNAKQNYCDWPSTSGCTPGGSGPSPSPTTVAPAPKPTPNLGTQLVSQVEFQCAAKTKGGNPDTSYYNGFTNAIPKASIRDKNEAAKFLAHAVWETVGFQYTKEVYCQTNMAACVAAYPNNNGGLPGKVYYGRGMLQLTWDYNYAACSQAMYGDNRLIQNPDQVSDIPDIGWGSAAWFWKVNVHSVSQTFGQTLKAINGALECDGGQNAQNRVLRFNHYKQVLQCLSIQAPPDSDGYCHA